MENTAISSKTRGFWSRQRLAWAGAAAFVGCAVSCSIPLLAVAASGGVLTSAAAWVKPGAELVVGTLAFAGALGWMAVRHRRRTRQTTACDCAPTPGPTRLFESSEPSADEPVVCTADLGNKPLIQQGVDSYRTAFSQLIATDRFAGGFRWRFRREPGLEARLQQLITAEHDCCRFFQFQLTTEGNEIVWETRARAHAASVMEEFSRMPERLRAEPRTVHDVATLKAKADTAGLRFAADESADKSS